MFMVSTLIRPTHGNISLVSWDSLNIVCFGQTEQCVVPKSQAVKSVGHFTVHIVSFLLSHLYLAKLRETEILLACGAGDASNSKSLEFKGEESQPSGLHPLF
ncbi:unnamed protein product [Victoria cruziana]